MSNFRDLLLLIAAERDPDPKARYHANYGLCELTRVMREDVRRSTDDADKLLQGDLKVMTGKISAGPSAYRDLSHYPELRSLMVCRTLRYLATSDLFVDPNGPEKCSDADEEEELSGSGEDMAGAPLGDQLLELVKADPADFFGVASLAVTLVTSTSESSVPSEDVVGLLSWNLGCSVTPFQVASLSVRLSRSLTCSL